MDIKKRKFKMTDKTWSEILSAPCDVSLQKILTGYVSARECDIIKTDSKKFMKLPVYCYIFKHKSGCYLIDAGLDMAHQINEYGSQKGLLKRKLASKARQGKGQSVSEYLKANNINPCGAFLTHTHFDHMAGLIDIPQCEKIIIARNEPYREAKPFYYGNYMKNIKKVEIIDFDGVSEMEPLGRAVDYFGDSSLYIVDTAGHSKGHLSFLVNSKSKPIFIAGDVYMYEDERFESSGPGNFTHDFKKAHKAITGIMKFKELYPDVEILSGHGGASDD